MPQKLGRYRRVDGIKLEFYDTNIFLRPKTMILNYFAKYRPMGYSAIQDGVHAIFSSSDAINMSHKLG